MQALTTFVASEEVPYCMQIIRLKETARRTYVSSIQLREKNNNDDHLILELLEAILLDY